MQGMLQIFQLPLQPTPEPNDTYNIYDRNSASWSFCESGAAKFRKFQTTMHFRIKKKTVCKQHIKSTAKNEH